MSDSNSGRQIRPVILAGGAGTRLWPLSTPARPKHMLPLLGDDSLFEQTLRRFGDRFRLCLGLLLQPFGLCSLFRAAPTTAADCQGTTDKRQK